VKGVVGRRRRQTRVRTYSFSSRPAEDSLRGVAAHRKVPEQEVGGPACQTQVLRATGRGRRGSATGGRVVGQQGIEISTLTRSWKVARKEAVVHRQTEKELLGTKGCLTTCGLGTSGFIPRLKTLNSTDGRLPSASPSPSSRKTYGKGNHAKTICLVTVPSLSHWSVRSCPPEPRTDGQGTTGDDAVTLWSEGFPSLS